MKFVCARAQSDIPRRAKESFECKPQCLEASVGVVE